MNRLLLTIALVLAGGLIFFGCRKNDPAQPSSGKAVAAATGKGAEAQTDAPSLDADGVLVLPDSTRQLLGIAVAPVRRQDFSAVQSVTIQVFREADERPLPGFFYRQGYAYGSAFIPREGEGFNVGESAKVTKGPGSIAEREARILQISSLSVATMGQKEILVEISDPRADFKLGMSCIVEFSSARVSNALVVPASALLNTTEGSFVYVQNNAGYRRVPVKTGPASGDLIEILDGLKEGDMVVAQPVQTLWLTELKLRSGGGEP